MTKKKGHWVPHTYITPEGSRKKRFEWVLGELPPKLVQTKKRRGILSFMQGSSEGLLRIEELRDKKIEEDSASGGEGTVGKHPERE